MRKRILPVLLLAAIAPAALAIAAPARVDNGAKPAEGRKDIALKELWRVGGEDDEIFFGNIGTVLRDKAGKIYILDTQQSQVQVYGPDGKHLATLGREGDGPGEVRQPAGMLLQPDGKIGLLQSFPGRIVMLNPDGTPGGQVNYQLAGSAEQGGFTFLNAGLGTATADMVLMGIRMTMVGSRSTQTFFLSRCDAQGAEKTCYWNREYAIDFADLKLDEVGMDMLMGRFAVAPDGRVYTAPDRDRYLIRVQAPDGTVEREITRAYTARPRTAEQRETTNRIYQAIASYYPAPLKGITIADTEPAVARLFLDDQGNLLVQANDTGDLPAGVFTVLDIFDKQGKFVRQLALRCPGDPDNDGLVVLGGGRVVLLRGALDAWLTQQAVASGKAATEAPALEVVCYSMP